MKITKCSNCTAMVSDAMMSCASCGFPNLGFVAPEGFLHRLGRGCLLTILGIVLFNVLVMILVFVLGSIGDTPTPASPPPIISPPSPSSPNPTGRRRNSRRKPSPEDKGIPVSSSESDRLDDLEERVEDDESTEEDHQIITPYSDDEIREILR